MAIAAQVIQLLDQLVPMEQTVAIPALAPIVAVLTQLAIAVYNVKKVRLILLLPAAVVKTILLAINILMVIAALLVENAKMVHPIIMNAVTALVLIVVAVK